MPSLQNIRFRASRSIELKRLSDLGDEQAEAFRELERDPEFYGLFVARPPFAMSLKAVTTQTAELFLTLREPMALEAALAGDDSVIDLVLDGILQIEGGDGFVSGADALPFIEDVIETNDSISRDALLYAQDLETSEIADLVAALYHYNRIPLTPFRKTRFPNGEAVLAHVGGKGLERDWIASEFGNHWLSWSARGSGPRDPDAPTFKLYVSPRPEHIREAFAALARVLSSFPGSAFKIGNSAAGLLRPDKLVAYFSTQEELNAAARELQRELAGCDAHGVPFTAPFDDAGLLSWGIDPPANDRALKWLGRNSWRTWLAQRLAGALAIAKSTRGNAAVEPWRFAIARARRHGVDIETWTPPASLWGRA
jgi:hypothetical protein